MDIDQRYPCVTDMKKAAKRRMPRFAYDFVTGGIGQGKAIARNRQDLDDILLKPRYLRDAFKADLRCELLGRTWDAPFGVAPVGLSSLMWQGAEKILAAAAKHHNVPYTLSTVGNVSLENIRSISGENAWFQFYPPNDPAIEDDLIKRAINAGYEVMMVTVDIPTVTRRAHDIRNGLTIPMKISLDTLVQCALKPTWSLRMLLRGLPEFDNISPYYPERASLGQSAQFVSNLLKGHIGAERFKRIRDAWPGKLLVKGILDPGDARGYLELGADGLVISNHGGRQLDGAPSSVSVLPQLRRELGDEVLLLADGGVCSGLDIARMIALGANFVLIGRPFIYAVAAMSKPGGNHLMGILKEELCMTMMQLGRASLRDLPEALYRKDRA